MAQLLLLVRVVYLLEKLFAKNSWIQNPSNSPDLAYLIEGVLLNLELKEGTQHH